MIKKINKLRSEFYGNREPKFFIQRPKHRQTLSEEKQEIFRNAFKRVLIAQNVPVADPPSPLPLERNKSEERLRVSSFKKKTTGRFRAPVLN